MGTKGAITYNEITKTTVSFLRKKYTYLRSGFDSNRSSAVSSGRASGITELALTEKTYLHLIDKQNKNLHLQRLCKPNTIFKAFKNFSR